MEKTYVQRIPTFEAKQFLGGEENAKEVIEWIEKFGLTSGRYQPPICAVIEAIGTDPVQITGENILVGGYARNALFAGSWIVCGRDAVKIMTDDEFKRNYEELI